MYTYLIMGAPFILIVLLIDTLVLKTYIIKTKSCWVVMAVMMLLTLVFDQLLTGLPIVFYDDTKRIGVELGYAPIEDFTYTFVVVILVGSMLKFFTKHEQAKD